MMRNPLGRALRGRRAGHNTLAWATPALQATENFTLSSPAFEHGAPIPQQHRGHIFRANVSPALVWSAPPPGTEELLLIVQDPDAPARRSATHALSAGIDPALGGIAENALTQPSPITGVRHGRGPLGRLGYAGPLPIPSHGEHSYVFQLFALDRRSELPEKFSLAEALDAMAGHLTGRARLDGTYEIL